jgi:hypothetical protein
VDFGDGSKLYDYKEDILTSSWLNVSNTASCQFRFTRIGRQVLAEILPFNLGTASGGTIQTALPSFVPAWAAPPSTIFSTSSCVVNSISLTMIGVIINSSGFVIHKCFGSTFGPWSGGETVNLSFKYSISYTV